MIKFHQRIPSRLYAISYKLSQLIRLILFGFHYLNFSFNWRDSIKRHFLISLFNFKVVN